MAMSIEAANYIRHVLSSCKGDDYERAKLAFGRMSESELESQWGQSGRTPKQILAEYAEHRRKHEQAEAEFERLLKN